MAQQAVSTVAKVEYPVTVEVSYPERLSRLSTFFRGLLIIPHLIVLSLIQIAVSVLDFIAWFAILFTGRFPKGMFDFVQGYLRWAVRVSAYSLLMTDKHPPYTMQ